MSVLTLTRNAEGERSSLSTWPEVFPKAQREANGSVSSVAGHTRRSAQCVGGGVRLLSLRDGVEGTAPWQTEIAPTLQNTLYGHRLDKTTRGLKSHGQHGARAPRV